MLCVNVFDDCFGLRSEIRQQVNRSKTAYPDLLTVISTVVTLNVERLIPIGNFTVFAFFFLRFPSFNRIEFRNRKPRSYNIVFIYVELVFRYAIRLVQCSVHATKGLRKCDVMPERNT